MNDFVSYEVIAPLQKSKPQKFDQQSRVWEPLYDASESLQTAIHFDDFAYYKLIIFSDMQDLRNSHPGKLRVNLNNVAVTVAMFNCEESHQCLTRKDFWWNFFIYDANARPVEFLRLGDSTPEKLFQIMR